MLADRVLELCPKLDRRGFCVGSIAPDCNVENEDWTSFTPSRAVTHWMSADRKSAADCESFYAEYIEKRRNLISTNEEISFLLGYYAHLIADAELQRYMRDEERVAAVWSRIKRHPRLSVLSTGLSEDWDTAKYLISKVERMKDIYTIEAEYLEAHPDSGYLTEIIGLESFPDYIDYLPKGAIVRKLGVMGYMPKSEASSEPFIAISREEYSTYLDMAFELIYDKINVGMMT